MTICLPTPLRGAGTLYVESMTSFISRLANVHCLSAGQLLDLLKSRIPAEDGETDIVNSIYARGPHELVGYSTAVKTLTRRLTLATGEHALSEASLLFLKPALSRNCRAAVHKVRRWCPACYSDFRRAGDSGYDLLIWHLQAITSCPVHGLVLENHCAACGQQQPFVRSTDNAIDCVSCHAALEGLPSEWVREERPTALQRAAIDLLAWRAAEDIRCVSPDALMTFLDLTFKYWPGLRPSIEVRMGMEAKRWRACLAGTAHVTLEVFLLACERCLVPPSLALAHPRLAAAVAVLPDNRIKAPGIKRIGRTKAERDSVGELVEAESAIADPAPPKPLSQICRQSGVSTGFARYHFPKLCEHLADTRRRRLAEARRGLRCRVSEAVEKHIAQPTQPNKSFVRHLLAEFGYPKNVVLAALRERMADSRRNLLDEGVSGTTR
ncbi:TniQ family protein [Dokdonella soli]|uniref:TniQ domain-containing protein n=1 Tax=Dokdonella soli TaxID=529810 RepID=A0ABN1IGY0_9GAMM